MQKTDIIQNPTQEQILACIREPIVRWRPQPFDPFFYISFSLNQFLQTHDKNFALQMVIESKQANTHQKQLNNIKIY